MDRKMECAQNDSGLRPPDSVSVSLGSCACEIGCVYLFGEKKKNVFFFSVIFWPLKCVPHAHEDDKLKMRFLYMISITLLLFQVLWIYLHF
ncbi:hypothetical protein TNIN_89501 [Trichonephila inaurata madagascariensis]|uniref:Transmembrane protein n=1 Tax=Trichonephila inaurata madagascariensis TaxID=2747483 RepID=A0A8X7CKE2_9ARAC|nr:hypothetical protein TNIN_89501 [Trichonephila inaurata madagascariensis]